LDQITAQVRLEIFYGCFAQHGVLLPVVLPIRMDHS
jgi:hypothetical protein